MMRGHRSRRGKDFVHPSGNRLARWSIAFLVELIGVVGRLQIDLASPNVERSRLGYESSRWVDRAGCADRDKKIGFAQSGVNLVHLKRHLAEPDDAGPEDAYPAAGWATIPKTKILAPLTYDLASHAARLQQFAVHVDDALGAGALMKVVDVLRDERQLASAFGQRGLGRARAKWAALGLAVISFRRRAL
jgi:hypothetical protein